MLPACEVAPMLAITGDAEDVLAARTSLALSVSQVLPQLLLPLADDNCGRSHCMWIEGVLCCAGFLGLVDELAMTMIKAWQSLPFLVTIETH
jgi:hypothetical protein